jgi:hypothetical protein
VNRVRRPPVQHPLALAFDGAVDSHCASLNPETARHYRGTVRNFLLYLAKDHPDLTLLASLRRDPHILGWMSHLRAQQPPLVTASYINRLLAMRCILTELAWMQQLTDLAHSIRSDDIPRLPQRLPRPLAPEQDQQLQQELVRRNDWGSNALLLIRHTGMRIGECAAANGAIAMYFAVARIHYSQITLAIHDFAAQSDRAKCDWASRRRDRKS